MGTSWASPSTAAAWRAAESLRAGLSTHFSDCSPGNGVAQPAGSAPKPIKAHTHQELVLQPQLSAGSRGSDGGTFAIKFQG